MHFAVKMAGATCSKRVANHFGQARKKKKEKHAMTRFSESAVN
jgi:hypothetical protein